VESASARTVPFSAVASPKRHAVDLVNTRVFHAILRRIQRQTHSAPVVQWSSCKGSVGPGIQVSPLTIASILSLLVPTQWQDALSVRSSSPDPPDEQPSSAGAPKQEQALVHQKALAKPSSSPSEQGQNTVERTASVCRMLRVASARQVWAFAMTSRFAKPNPPAQALLRQRQRRLLYSLLPAVTRPLSRLFQQVGFSWDRINQLSDAFDLFLAPAKHQRLLFICRGPCTRRDIINERKLDSFLDVRALQSHERWPQHQLRQSLRRRQRYEFSQAQCSDSRCNLSSL